MAWTTPPTFADGDYLTASNLNILSDDIEHLHGLAYQVNTGFFVQEITTDSGGYDTAGVWAVKHWSNTFRYIVNVTAGTIDEFLIYANGNTSNVIYQDNTNRSNPYTWSGTADITALGLTVGAVYTIHVRVRGTSGSNGDTVQVFYLGEDF